MSKRAILYARVSGDDRRGATSSIEAQLDECRAYCEQQGYTVVDELFEEPNKNTSGYEMFLPELDRAIQLAREGTYDVLVPREIDRLARRRFKQLFIELELEKHDVVVEYARGQYAPTPEGNLSKGIAGELAEYERLKIAERTKRGRMRSAVVGRVMAGGSHAPYGYTFNPEARTLVANEAEAKIVRLIFDLYVNQGYTLRKLCHHLDDHKIAKPGKGACHEATRRKDAGWSSSTVANILTNETYLGAWHYHKTRPVKDPHTGKRRTNTPRPRDEWVQIDVPAIIAKELFEAAARMRRENQRLSGGKRRFSYALSGMVICGHCGGAVCGITKATREKKYSYYKCLRRDNPRRYGGECDSRTCRVEDLEAAVWAWIRRLVLDPETLRIALEDAQEGREERLRPTLAMVENLQADLASKRREKERLIRSYTQGVMELDELAETKAELDKRIDELTQAIAHLLADAEPQMLTAEQVETIESIAAEVRDGADIAEDDPEIQKRLYQLLDVKVTLHSEKDSHVADVQCELGVNVLPVGYSTALGTVHGCKIHAQLTVGKAIPVDNWPVSVRVALAHDC